jgi:predicted SnoaL-like aldol condensation-catalyzing enzyme
MKKILLAVSAASLCFLISCNNDKTTTASSSETTSTQAQKNLDASHIVTKAFETGDASQIDSAVAADFVDHNEHGTGNRDSLKAMVGMVKKMDPNGKMETEKEFADDDYVFSLIHFTGTSNGTMGMPAGPYDFREIEVVRFKDGKAVEHWAYIQPTDMMKMMPQPAPDKMKSK